MGDKRELDAFTREQLYELAWSEPLRTLAPKYGMSDVAFKKRCKKLGVPTPSLGYWNKLAAGKPVKRSPLPATWTYKPKKARIPQSVDEIKRYPLPEKDYTLARPNQLVRHTRSLLRQSGYNEHHLREVRHRGALKTKLSDASIPRGMWLWNELLSRLPQAALYIDTNEGIEGLRRPTVNSHRTKGVCSEV